MTNLGIRARVLLLAVIPALLIALLLTLNATVNSLRELDRNLHERGRTIAAQLAAASEYGAISGNHQILQNLVQQTMMHGDEIEAVLVTDDLGRTLAVSGKLTLPKPLADKSATTSPGQLESRSAERGGGCWQ